MKLGDMIKQYREERGLSQRAFARRCGLSNAQIAFLEKGIGNSGKPFEPTFDTVRKVARGMGTSAEVLLVECEEFRLTLGDRDMTEDEEIAFLLFDGEPVTQAQIDEVKRFARWIKERDSK